VKLDRGIFAALGAAALFGLSTPVAKTLVGEMSPLLLAGLLYTGSGAGLSILLAARAIGLGRASIVRPRGADLMWLLGAIAFGGAIGPYLLMYGLQMTDSASASLILNLEGVFTAVLANCCRYGADSCRRRGLVDGFRASRGRFRGTPRNRWRLSRVGNR
jgi:drug/metabolite transporter (DMT)-like permease